MSKAHMHIHGLQKMSLEQKIDQVDTDSITPMVQAFCKCLAHSFFIFCTQKIFDDPSRSARRRV